MSKALVIAEKPSVAGDLSRALGRFEKKDEYYENDRYVIASAIGHLIELREPAAQVPAGGGRKPGKWTFHALPVIPDEFELAPIDEKSESRFKLLKRLMARKDVDEIINACDAGREGELIFRYLVKLAGTKKPIRRLWLQSMTAESIREAFGRLRSDEEMVPLAKAAFSRAESDWLVGINATRAMTAFNSKLGGFQLTPVGRVQTPTLAILVERDEKIRAFRPRTYFEVHADFEVRAGQYHGRWFDPAFRKGADEDARAERLFDRERADAIRDKCAGKTGTVTEEKKPTSQLPPLLYDLTTLQREANGRFGFSAKRTLQIAQALYEKHKVLTYPRTDSRYLPEDYLGQVKQTLGAFEDDSLARHAQRALSQGWVRPNRRIFDNAKISDHNAIIPTGKVPGNLEDAEARLYDLVARRFIAVFFPAAQFEVTTRVTVVEGENFKTEGKVITDPGWMAVYGRQAAATPAPGQENGADDELVPVAQREPARTAAIETRELQTKPPPRFNEATLLSAMEGAGKLVEDEELRAAMSAKGLGTPATRAAVIEGLLKDDYIARQGRELNATAKGASLIALLRALGVDALTKPELTGEWESRLKQMEAGGLRRDTFMTGIRDLTRDIVERAKNFEGDTIEGSFGELDVSCPKCGARPLKEEYRIYRCLSCDYVFWKTLAGRGFAPEEVTALLRQGEIGPLDGFRSKQGRSFSAKVRLNPEGKAEFNFDDANNNGGGNGSAEGGGVSSEDLAQKTPLHLCPVCAKGQVYEFETQYACERAVVDAKRDCTFRMGKVILQQEISPGQATKLLTEGKTDLLTKFVSKKSRAGKPFSAFLKLEKGKVVFEFPPREGGSGNGADRRAKSRSGAGAKRGRFPAKSGQA